MAWEKRFASKVRAICKKSPAKSERLFPRKVWRYNLSALAYRLFA